MSERVDDLALLFADARWFMVGASQEASDKAMRAASDLSSSSLDAFAEAAGGCSRLPLPGIPQPAKVVMEGTVAIIQPGTGAANIPKDATAIAMDLRDGRGRPEYLPQILEFLETAATKRSELSEAFIQSNGMPDEIFAPGKNLYVASLGHRLAVHGRTPTKSSIPLAFLTDARLSPEIASVVIATRLAGNGLVFGEHIVTRAAEYHVVAHTALRTAELSTSGAVLPDILNADVRTATPLKELWRLSAQQSPPLVTSSPVDSVWPTNSPVALGTARPPEASLVVGRAALLEAYAANRTFYPYFPNEQKERRDSLVRALAELGSSPSSVNIAHAIGTLTSSWKDGHALAFHSDPKAYRKLFGAEFEFLEDTPRLLVSKSVASLNAGDEILSFNGSSLPTLFNEGIKHTSAGHRRRQLVGALTDVLAGPAASIEVRSPLGVTRSVTVPTSSSDYPKLTDWTRPSGSLGDLGRSDVFYINLNDNIAAGTPHSVVEAAKASNGVIFDMRGYPGVQSYALVAEFISRESRGFQFTNRTYSWRGADTGETSIQTIADLAGGTASPYLGKLVLLVDTFTQSSAENLAAFLVKRGAKTIGRRTSGANGNITALWLCGGFGVSFTGLEAVLIPQSEFHGNGIEPDIALERSIVDVASATDTFLQRALAEL